MKCVLFTLAASLLLSGHHVLADEAQSKWQWDAGIYAMYDWHDFEGSLFDEAGITPSQMNFLRRVKASAEIEYNDKIAAEIAVEYKDLENTTDIDDLNISYKFTDHVKIVVGKFKEPLGLENQLSLRWQPTLERSAPTNTMIFGRNTGVALDIEHDYWTVDIAMTHREAPGPNQRDSLAHTFRATLAPIQKKKKFLHFGVDFSNRLANEDEYDIDEPLAAQGVGNLIHSPRFDAQEIKLQGAEFAARYKPVLLMSEYFEQRIRLADEPDQTMHGHYVTTVWTLFGEKREYRDGKIKFEGKDPHTLELAYRYSKTDLAPVFRGDVARVTTTSLNYFYKKHLRLSVEYQDAELASSGRRNTDYLDGKSLNGRIQVAF